VQNPDDRGYFVKQLERRKRQKPDGGKHSFEQKTSEFQESIFIILKI